GIQHQNVGDIALVVLLDQLLLLGRALNVQVDDDKVHLGAVFVVQLNSALRLSFGVEASFAVNNDVVGLARNKSRLRIISRDQRTIEAVACVIAFRIELHSIDGQRSRAGQHRQQKEME